MLGEEINLFLVLVFEVMIFGFWKDFNIFDGKGFGEEMGMKGFGVIEKDRRLLFYRVYWFSRFFKIGLRDVYSNLVRREIVFGGVE